MEVVNPRRGQPTRTPPSSMDQPKVSVSSGLRGSLGFSSLPLSCPGHWTVLPSFFPHRASPGRCLGRIPKVGDTLSETRNLT